MSIKKMYYYSFYKFYKLFEAFQQTKWLSDFKAALILLVLEVSFLISLKNYYLDFYDHNDEFIFLSIQTLVPFVSLFIINYLAFINNDKWKDYVQEFDQWPSDKNIRGTWIVIAIVLFVIFNFIFSFYMMGVVFKRW